MPLAACSGQLDLALTFAKPRAVGLGIIIHAAMALHPFLIGGMRPIRVFQRPPAGPA